MELARCCCFFVLLLAVGWRDGSWLLGRPSAVGNAQAIAASPSSPSHAVRSPTSNKWLLALHDADVHTLQPLRAYKVPHPPHDPAPPSEYNARTRARDSCKSPHAHTQCRTHSGTKHVRGAFEMYGGNCFHSAAVFADSAK